MHVPVAIPRRIAGVPFPRWAAPLVALLLVGAVAVAAYTRWYAPTPQAGWTLAGPGSNRQPRMTPERLRVLARQMAVRGLALGLEPDEIAEAVRAELAAHGRPVSGSPIQASLGQEEAPLLSARNRLRGRVAAIRAGELLAEVTIDLREGAQVVAAVTRSSVDRLGLENGAPVSVYVKATELTLGP